MPITKAEARTIQTAYDILDGVADRFKRREEFERIAYTALQAEQRYRRARPAHMRPPAGFPAHLAARLFAVRAVRCALDMWTRGGCPDILMVHPRDYEALRREYQLALALIADEPAKWAKAVTAPPYGGVYWGEVDKLDYARFMA